MSATLNVTNVTAGYGDVAVVRDLEMTVAAGEVVALFGPNGAGKSTTLLTIAGVLPVLGGEVTWDGNPLLGPLHSRARAGLSFVPEERSVLMGLSVRDNLRLGRGEVEDALEIFPELERLLGRRAGLLSGGEQQMLSLGRALAARPQLLIVDELSLGLAPLAVERLLDALKGAARSTGVAVLMVEQQARRALHVTDRWYLMRRGGIAASGTARSGIDELETAYLATAESA